MVLTKLNAYGLNLRDEIRRERRVELALEGERYFDLLRWKQGDLLAKDVTGMRKSTVPPVNMFMSKIFLPTIKGI